MNEKPLARNKEIVIQQLKDETLIYDLTVNKAYCLNETSALIWEMCDGQTSVFAIREKLSKRLNLPAPEDLIWLAIDQFKKDNLLDTEQKNQPLKFDSVSRRAVIRQIGFGSMLALPIISSLIAPTAAMAASGCVNPGGFPAGNINAICTDPTASPTTCNNVCQILFGSFCCSGKNVPENCVINGVTGVKTCECNCT